MAGSLFTGNPRRRDLAHGDRELVELCEDAAARFSELRVHHRGESLEIRKTDVPGLLVQRMIPSLNSISRGRKGVVEGTDRLRHDISCVFWEELHRREIATCHLAHVDPFVLITEERVPAIEVIVKAALVGTPARIYHGIFDQTDRFGRQFEAFRPHAPYVRFDYRNPLFSPTGERLRDECMPRALADRFIDTERATASALAAFEVVKRVLVRVDLAVLDACFLFDVTGRVLCYEVSPDNMRVKRGDWERSGCFEEAFDKDLWREGADERAIVEKWTAFRRELRGPDA